MNCYAVSNEDTCEIVFAETAGKAKAFAIGLCENLDGEEFTDVRATRLPFCDHLDTGEMKQLDWCTNAALFSSKGWLCHSTGSCYETYCPFLVEERKELGELAAMR